MTTNPLRNAAVVNPSYQQVENAYSKARRLHGELGITLAEFQSHLLSVWNQRHGTTGLTLLQYLSQCHTSDLYVTGACRPDNERAWSYFVPLFHSAIDELAHRCCSSLDLAAELADRVLFDLYLPNSWGKSRLRQYDGSIALSHWLRVVVAHRAHTEAKRKDNTHTSLSVVLEQPGDTPVNNIEAEIAGTEYKAIIAETLRTAVAVLDLRERALILARYRDHQRGLEIGQRMNISASTVTRETARAREKLRAEAMSVFASRYRLEGAALNDCVSVMVSAGHNIFGMLASSAALDSSDLRAHTHLAQNFSEESFQMPAIFSGSGVVNIEGP